jgi:multicomponent Na+:H+ antiporter subunit F
MNTMVQTGATIAFVIIIIAFFLAFIRLLRGPRLPDRVVSLDLMASLVMGIILTYSMISGNSVYIDIVMIISLLLFLGTVIIAIYLKKKEKDGV